MYIISDSITYISQSHVFRQQYALQPMAYVTRFHPVIETCKRNSRYN